MRLLRLFLLGLFASVVCSCGPLHAQPANVMADPTTGALFRPSAATFISGNSLLTSTAAAAAYQPIDSDLTAIAALTTTANGRSLLTLASVPSGALVGTSDTQTLTNKTLTTPNIGAATGTSVNLTGTGYFGSTVRLTNATESEIQSYTGAAYTPHTVDALSFAWKTSGGTADMTIGTTGIVGISNATASTNTSTGALTVGGGIGVAGAINAADDISIIGTAATDRTLKVQSLGAQYAQLKMNTNSSTANNFQVLVESGGRVYFQQNNGAINTLQIESTGHATYSKRWNVSDTTSASSSTAGALTIGNGTAATNVAIGGGNVNAGGALTVGGTVIHTLSATPASASAAGTVGTISWDTSYIYICTATNTWKRVAIATW